MNYVYILRCADGTLYTGWTTDLARRVKTHDAGKGAKYTRSRRPVRLAYFECFEEKVPAQQREREIKKLTRQEKGVLIAGLSPKQNALIEEINASLSEDR